MNALANELNAILDGTAAGRLLSRRGRRLYFPRGIIAQSAEAKAKGHTANGTIGIAQQGGHPLILPAIAEAMPGLRPEEAVAYAPTAGVEELRRLWKEQILAKNPGLDPERISLPAVTPGLTAGLSYLADLFLDEGQTMLASDPSWDNYPLIFEERMGARFRAIPFFGEGQGGGGLDLEAIRAAIQEEARTGQVRIAINFPNNPSGYAPTESEARAIAAMLREAAEGGADVFVICDDAYFGLFYEDDVWPVSLFSLLAHLHERIVAAKVDGPIKEDYAWGLRAGFVTFGGAGLGPEHYDALQKKLMGAIRSSVSCANTPAQSFLLKALRDPRTPDEKARFHRLMQSRYEAVRTFLAGHPNHPYLKPLPFNSGYFMCFRCQGIDAEALRRALLDDYGIGVVALGSDCLRIAYSGLDLEKIPLVYETIYKAARSLGDGQDKNV
ncbi:MAG: aminotransferase class I/II-fold pyridoxal phosphate-dependent enzyme [Treponema sp.]|jgi:aspartate/methionine/tyrosine aminotransferase|nr:aminotransferase class I/II-fold pyridoxal phosphate-dependent enzyme [Treponema sp.]